MAFATDTYAGDGSTVEFDLTFDFISREHVTVTRIDAAEVETTLTVIASGSPTGDEFVWESDDKIKVGTAPASGETLQIVRNTPDTVQIIQWSDGSYITSEDLNTEGEQFLYLIQELDDTVSTLDRETNADLDALEERVEKNEGDIKDLQDKDTSLDGDIAALDARVTTNEGDIANIDQALTGLGKYVYEELEPRVTKNEGDITDLDQGLTNLGNYVTGTVEPKVDKNTQDIAALDSRVTTNEGNISTNTGNISTNTSDIADLRKDVDDNADEIDDLKAKSGVSKIVAGTNVTIDPTDGKGEVTISADATPYTLPIASASVLGGIKVGANLSISGSGVLSATGGGGGGSTITFKGTANFTGTAPANPAVGDLYLNDTAGTGAWAGFSGDAVGVNDRAFFNGADWDRLPGTGGDQIQSDWNQSDSALVDFIKNKPALATVATSGSYNDLSDKPAIPAAQVQSDWDQGDSSAVDFIKNKPTIPGPAPVTSVNGKTGAVVLKTSNLENDSGYITSSDVSYPVTKVNGKTGDVTLTASDVGALPSSTSLAFVPLGSWSGIPEL